MNFFTIGYEGATVSSFWETLVAYGVTKLIDVRQLPLSRKTGFSKSALANASHNNHIQYEHLKVLGCPRAIRNEYKIDLDWQRYTIQFNAYLETQDEAIQQLADQITKNRCCLLCFEADVNSCHRLYISQAVAKIVPSISVTHLKVKKEFPVVLSPAFA